MPPSFDTLTFEFPPGWQAGLPLAVAALAWMVWACRRERVTWGRTAILTGLRAAALLTLAFLAARPAWVSRERVGQASRDVALLFDRSESMSLEEGAKTRYQQALAFARESLLPSIKEAGLNPKALLFDEQAEPATGGQLNAAAARGRRTNLGRAIARAVENSAPPPLAVIALTDGIANENADNSRGLLALVENRTPFIGLGLGSDTGARTLSLRLVDAPTSIPTNTLFRVSAELEMASEEELPPFDLVLMRDGLVAQKRLIQPGKGTRVWLESFQVSEPAEGVRQYTVQFLPPTAPGLKCANSIASTTVQVSSEKELRILYVQGALTWDYKFAAWALKGDPSVRLTGLTRTSRQSIFRQNVETSDELLRGFPTTMDEIAPFRVVVLANLSPADLAPAQQELLARFCGELGGGVLMIGGPATFNPAWQGSRLEQVLPVTFASSAGVQGLDRPFNWRPTEEALRHPLFQLAGDRSSREIWSRLPPFLQYGRVNAPKPGAMIWVEHPEDEGPVGKRILMASQRFGAGVSAVICVQNFWRWRLARESETQYFDRFWRQLLRFLSEPSRQEIVIQLADQELRPEADVRVTVEKKPLPSDLPGPPQRFLLKIAETERNVFEQSLELTPGRPVETSFRADKAGLYRITVMDAQKKVVGSRSVEIRDFNVEFAQTARNMETLRQWASLSGGLAFAVEDCPSGASLVARIREKVEEARRFRPLRQPAGVNVWTLLLVAGALAGEWTLRKRWNLR